MVSVGHEEGESEMHVGSRHSWGVRMGRIGERMVDLPPPCSPPPGGGASHIYTAAHPTRTAQLHAPPHTCAQRAAARDACGESDCMVMHA